MFLCGAIAFAAANVSTNESPGAILSMRIGLPLVNFFRGGHAGKFTKRSVVS